MAARVCLWAAERAIDEVGEAIQKLVLDCRLSRGVDGKVYVAVAAAVAGRLMPTVTRPAVAY
jgi:hypothetical protein